MITLGNSATFAIQHLSTPLRNVVRDGDPDAFYAPGTLLRVDVDTTHPIGYGMPAEADVLSRLGPTALKRTSEKRLNDLAKKDNDESRAALTGAMNP